MSDVGGWMAVLAFVATLIAAKAGQSAPGHLLASLANLMIVPLAVASVWRFALTFGWWAIAVFVACTFVSAFVLMVAKRRAGWLTLVLLHPWLTLAAAGAALASWLN